MGVTGSGRNVKEIHQLAQEIDAWLSTLSGDDLSYASEVFHPIIGIVCGCPITYETITVLEYYLHEDLRIASFTPKTFFTYVTRIRELLIECRASA